MATLDYITRSKRVLDHLRSPVLAAIRVYWGWQFAITGWGKLANFDRTVGWFESLGLPFAEANVALAAGTELLGGLFLAIGLLGRPWAAALGFTMVVAYGTAHVAEASAILSDPMVFVGATPFSFLLASLIVLGVGSGTWSADHLLLTWLRSPKPSEDADERALHAVTADMTP